MFQVLCIIMLHHYIMHPPVCAELMLKLLKYLMHGTWNESQPNIDVSEVRTRDLEINIGFHIY